VTVDRAAVGRELVERTCERIQPAANCDQDVLHQTRTRSGPPGDQQVDIRWGPRVEKGDSIGGVATNVGGDAADQYDAVARYVGEMYKPGNSSIPGSWTWFLFVASSLAAPLILCNQPVELIKIVYVGSYDNKFMF
jgi:hypothetical protein